MKGYVRITKPQYSYAILVDENDNKIIIKPNDQYRVLTLEYDAHL